MITKQEIVEELAKRLNIKQWHAKQILNAVISVMTDFFIQGETIHFRRFGTFYVRTYKHRLNFNIRTGKMVLLQPKKMVYFKPSKVLRKKLA